ncbi:hypothetical protein AMTR_s00046p00061320 [Amborella trichopoda]|uniref:Uncharacterized protein n=1 Tax=Amborella trichopoda TaxID=13333 RepID=U5D6R0_AMBTC|nr:hypothetical protein AMTR_s00046p00061320 [Amborella trichopoda]
MSPTIEDMVMIMGLRGDRELFMSIPPEKGVDHRKVIKGNLGVVPHHESKKKGKNHIYLNWLENDFGGGVAARVRSLRGNQVTTGTTSCL